MPDEQAAHLRALEQAASEPDQAVAQLAEKEAAAEVQAEQSLSEKNAAALSMFCELLVPTLDKFGYTTVAGVIAAPADDMPDMTNGQALAAVWAPVLAKYGINLGDMGDKYKLEIVAVMVTVPIAKAIYGAMKTDTGKPAPRAAAPQVEAAAAAPAVLGTSEAAA